MDSLMSENLHASSSKLERMVDRLMRGRETVILLQTRLKDPIPAHELVSAQELALKIFESFDESISELSSCADSADSTRIAAVEGGGSACSGDSKKRPAGVKDRRGCYKRRRNSESWNKISSTIEDGFAWRKYGQKAILNSEYPRCYYRCTHKYEGCKAQRQVQRMKDDPILYQITYINNHTCIDKFRAPPLILNDYSDPHEEPVNLLSFQANHHNPNFEQANINSKNPMIISDPMKKEDELKEDAQSTGDLSDSKSSLLDPTWENIINGSGSVGYRPVLDQMISSYQEVGSEFHYINRSLYGFHFEDNQLGDIDNFNFGEL